CFLRSRKRTRECKAGIEWHHALPFDFDLVPVTLVLRCFRDGPWLPVTLLIRADKLCIGQDVAPHCSLDLRFRRVSYIDHHIQRIELMEVTVPADRRTRAAIARLFEIIEPK